MNPISRGGRQRIAEEQELRAKAPVSRRLLAMAARTTVDAFLPRWKGCRRRFGTWELWPVASGFELAAMDVEEAQGLILARLREVTGRESLAIHVAPIRKVRGTAGWTLGFRVTVSPVAKVARVKKAKRTYWPVPRRHRAI